MRGYPHNNQLKIGKYHGNFNNQWTFEPLL